MPGYRFSPRGSALEAAEALDVPIFSRFSSPEEIPPDLEIRVDNGSQFGARRYLAEIERLGVKLSKSYCKNPDGNAVVERFFRILKEECVWQHQFESFEQAEKTVSEWIDFHNTERVVRPLGISVLFNIEANVWKDSGKLLEKVS